MIRMKKHPTLGLMVRSDGLILLPGRYKNHSEYWTTGCTWARGYKVVVYKKKRYKVHRLVAETFIDNPDNLPFIDHIDRNPTNNSLENLRWASCQTNNLNRDLVINARARLGFDVSADTIEVRKARANEWYNSKSGQEYYKQKYAQRTRQAGNN